MSSMISYSAFKKDIIKAFNQLINEFKFEIYELYEGCYELRNSYCILRFTYDRGDVNCNVRPVGDEGLGYGIMSIYRYLFPRDDSYKNLIYDPLLQLKAYSEVLQSKLRILLEGNFSWLEGYIESEKKLNKLIKFVWDHFDENHPIYIKFRNGDLTWQSDLELYLRENRIDP